MKKLIFSATIAASAVAFAGSAVAEDIFALVPKNMNNPFFDQARDGCKKAEKEADGAFKCEYIGPGEHGGGEEQVQIVMDLVARGNVKGIGVAPANAAAMAVAHEIAEKAPLAMKYAKQTANMVEEMPQRDAYRMEQNFTMALSKSEDALEARMSFLEKRKPVFK